ncbi:MAG: TIGR03364 family FAD-dependent oxidoreductase [Burkholderiales bacterium]|nr:TIGR03364 family FAD-dependent oxidoreductase [Burkholderiales bacterium]
MSSDRQYDLAVVGAGIVGLAHAYAAAQRGLRVVVFDRETRAVGASVRNFGLGLSLGQAPGEMRELALASRETWLDVLPKAGCWHKAAGSLLVARNPLEQQVLEEFQASRDLDYGTRLMTRAELATHRLDADMGLFSPFEIALESRRAIPALASWLAASYPITFEWGCQVNAIAAPTVHTSGGTWRADKVLIAAGDDFKTLYPEAFAPLGVSRCKLQMLRLANPGHAIGPALLTGLSCLHYPAFAECTSKAALAAQVAEQTPLLAQHGIHLIVQQVGESGDLIVGDSHDYADSIDPFDDPQVDALLLELAESLLGQALSVKARWHGVYGVGPKPYEILRPADHVAAVAVTSGVGMSISFALAERVLDTLLEPA